MPDHFRSIICTVDFSPFSRAVLRCGIALAGKFNARLFVFHSVFFPQDPLYRTAVFEQAALIKNRMAKAGSRIKHLMADTKIRWRSVVSCGDPVDELKVLSNREPAPLVIAASHGISGLQRLFIGTVVERMADTLNTPMLVIRPKGAEIDETHKVPVSFDTLIVCCDMKNHSRNIIHTAAAMADTINAKIYLVHALEQPINAGIVDPTNGPYDKVQKKLMAHLARDLEKRGKEQLSDFSQIKIVLLTGAAGDELPEYVKTSQADLVVVGVRKKRRLGKAISGSTTDKVLRLTTCAVLTVPVK